MSPGFYHTRNAFQENTYVCIFVWSFSSYSTIFHSFGEVTIANEGLHILTFARQLLQLSSEVSLAFTPTVTRGIRL